MLKERRKKIAVQVRRKFKESLADSPVDTDWTLTDGAHALVVSVCESASLEVTNAARAFVYAHVS
jgi:hypothetical protein